MGPDRGRDARRRSRARGGRRDSYLVLQHEPSILADRRLLGIRRLHRRRNLRRRHDGSERSAPGALDPRLACADRRTAPTGPSREGAARLDLADVSGSVVGGRVGCVLPRARACAAPEHPGWEPVTSQTGSNVCASDRSLVLPGAHRQMGLQPWNDGKTCGSFFPVGDGRREGARVAVTSTGASRSAPNRCRPSHLRWCVATSRCATRGGSRVPQPPARSI